MLVNNLLGNTVQGEGKLFTLLGTNATLGGLKAMLEKTHQTLEPIVPTCSDLIVIIQVGIGLATLIYMVLKIKKVLKSKK